jgi:hypothetical protein
MWRIYKDWGLWLAFILALSCYLIASGGKIGITPDSYYYLAAAENWAYNGQLIDHQGNVYANWPPLYPLLLSLGVPHILSFATWLHAFALLISVYFFAQCLPDKLPITVRNTALWSYALYAPLLACSIYLWSEVVFMTLLMAAFAAFQRKEKPVMLVGYLILANLMCWQRNAGIFFVIAWTIAQFFTAKHTEIVPQSLLCSTNISPRNVNAQLFVVKLIRRIGAIALEGGLASVTFIAWQLRNFFWVADVQDFRQNIALVSLSESIKLSLSAMSTWLLPLQVAEISRVAIFLCAIAVLALLAVRNTRQRQVNMPLLLTFACYLAATWVLRMNLPSENDRYFLPLFPFLLFLIISALQEYPKIIVPLLLSICIYQTARGLKNTHQWHQQHATSSALNNFESHISMSLHNGKINPRQGEQHKMVIKGCCHVLPMYSACSTHGNVQWRCATAACNGTYLYNAPKYAHLL